MYVADRHIKVNVDGKVVHLKPGDEVVGFEGWGEVVKRSNLSSGFVKRVEAEAATKKAPTKKKN